MHDRQSSVPVHLLRSLLLTRPRGEYTFRESPSHHLSEPPPSPVFYHAQSCLHPFPLARLSPLLKRPPKDDIRIVPPPVLPILPVQIVTKQHLQRPHLGPILLILPFARLADVQPAQAPEEPLVKQRVQIHGGKTPARIDARLPACHEREALQRLGEFPICRRERVGHVPEARVDVVQRHGEVCQVREPVEHGVELPVLDVRQVVQFCVGERAAEGLQERPDARVVQPRAVAYAQRVQRRREVVGLSEQVPEEFAVDATGEGEVLEFRRPADVDGERTGFVARRASREVDALDAAKLAQRLRQRLEADALADQAQVQHPQSLTFGQRGPAVHCEAGLRRNEDLQARFGAAEQARSGRLCALVDNVREVERLDKAREGLVFDMGEHAGADCAHEEIVGAAGEVGLVVEGADGNIIPLPVSCEYTDSSIWAL